MTKKQIEDNIESCLDLIINSKMDHKFLIQLSRNTKQDFKVYVNKVNKIINLLKQRIKELEGEYEQD